MSIKTQGIVAGLALTALAVGPAKAEFYSGNELYNFCLDSSSRIYVGMYSAGVLGKAEAWGLDTSCVPRKTQLRQLTDVVCIYLAKNPAKRTNMGSDIVSEAIDEAWPCPKQDKKP